MYRVDQSKLMQRIAFKELSDFEFNFLYEIFILQRTSP